MAKRPTVVDQVMSEQIRVPGFPAYRASRATVYRELIASGASPRMADYFAFSSVLTRDLWGEGPVETLTPWPGREAMIAAHPELADML